MKLFDTYNGQAVHEITLKSDLLSVTIRTLGATISDITTSDRDGNPVHVALSVNDAEAMVGDCGYMGAIIGRCGNRMGGGGFTLNGKRYNVFNNADNAHLHGGKDGFNKKVFSVLEISEQTALFGCSSDDGEEGYPGNLGLQVRYTVDGASLSIEYFARCDEDTIFNPTNHVYFNLNGEGNGNIENTIMQIYADAFLTVSEALLPNGMRLLTDGDPFDFRTPKAIGRDINMDDKQIHIVGGYDHNYCLGLGDEHAATAYCEENGVVLDVYTDRPGVQFYTGNFLNGVQGKHLYNKRAGFCLETQTYPNAANVACFPTAVLKKGDEFYSKTVYAFSVKK